MPSGLEKISDLPDVCTHPEHASPKFMDMEPGLYRYTCPACSEQTVFLVPRVSWCW